jgi:hypothetical protein
MIYCIGDSFTYGDELPDTNLAWPSLLDAETVNLGRNAGTNDRIIRRAMDIVLGDPGNKIIVAWSTTSRAEIVDQHGIFSYWPGRNNIWVRDADRTNLIKSVTAMACDDTYKWMHRNWLRDVILLQTFFKYHNQPYLMIMSHQAQFQNEMYLVNSDLHRDLGQHVDTEFFLGWPQTGMVEWVGDCPKGPNGHPLELGHERIAEKINEHIRNLGWLS